MMNKYKRSFNGKNFPKSQKNINPMLSYSSVLAFISAILFTIIVYVATSLLFKVII